MTFRTRKAAERRGRMAETLAAALLTLKGYRILARRFRAGPGEIDLVARRGRTLAIVEVKARKTLDAAREAITPQSRRRIERAADVFLAQRQRYAGFDLRYDAIFIAGFSVRHERAAWRAGD